MRFLWLTMTSEVFGLQPQAQTSGFLSTPKNLPPAVLMFPIIYMDLLRGVDCSSRWSNCPLYGQGQLVKGRTKGCLQSRQVHSCSAYVHHQVRYLACRLDVN